MKKKSNKILSATLAFIILFTAACSSQKEWLPARVVYNNGDESELLVKPQKATYYTFIKSKHLSDSGKIIILIPEEVKLIEGNDFAYVSMYFDEKNYGMETWSFGRVLAGDSIIIAETKFQFKTCACKTAGKFFHGYFIIAQENHLKIRTDNKNIVHNKSEIYKFVDQYCEIPLPDQINTINDLILFLKNINN